MPDYSVMTKEELIVEVEARDAEIVTLNQTIADKDAEIANLNTTITDKDNEITSLNTTIQNKDAEITTLNQTVTDKDVIIEDKIEEVQGLNEEISTMKTPDGLLGTVIEMPSEDKRDLAHKIRTTNEGIKTYFAINYGAEAPQEALIEEDI